MNVLEHRRDTEGTKEMSATAQVTRTAREKAAALLANAKPALLKSAYVTTLEAWIRGGRTDAILSATMVMLEDAMDSAGIDVDQLLTDCGL